MLARQAVLILITMAVLTAVTVWLLGGQKKVYTTTARIWIQTEQQGTPAFLSGLAAFRDSPYPDPVARKIETGKFDELYAAVKPKGVTVSALLSRAVALAPADGAKVCVQL